MILNYLMAILLLLVIVRWIQLKRSIRNRNYDYSYYEDGPYSKKKRKKTFWEKVKGVFRG